MSEQDVRESLLATILSEESYRPNEPESLKEAGLTVALVEGLICKRLSMVGMSSGRQIADHVCLPFRLLEPVFHELRSRQIIVHKNSAPLNDYNYALTEQGNDRARIAMDACAYVGAAPVPLLDYVLSAEAQSIRAEAPKREDLRDAFEDITIDEELFENLGPAINSGAGLFLYGEPGNGKSTLAKRITQCFGQDIWIPKVVIEDGQLIKLYDAAVHEPSAEDESSILKSAAYDRRWIKIRRPTVIVGGELTMDGLEIRYDPHSNVSEAPLQMKSNCGCLLIDDFGRQRIDPVELLNRWIVPLESRYDFLTLSTGKKIQVPFEQLIIFSTNLDPAALTDEAFLRRIPYKIEIGDPAADEFHELFEIYADVFDCEYRPDVIDVLIDKHYLGAGRAMRRCHPRDLLQQIRNFCSYNELEMEMRDEYFDRIVKSYFSVVLDTSHSQTAATVDRHEAGVRNPQKATVARETAASSAPPVPPQDGNTLSEKAIRQTQVTQVFGTQVADPEQLKQAASESQAPEPVSRPPQPTQANADKAVAPAHLVPASSPREPQTAAAPQAASPAPRSAPPQAPASPATPPPTAAPAPPNPPTKAPARPPLAAKPLPANDDVARSAAKATPPRKPAPAAPAAPAQPIVPPANERNTPPTPENPAHA